MVENGRGPPGEWTTLNPKKVRRTGEDLLTVDAVRPEAMVNRTYSIPSTLLLFAGSTRRAVLSIPHPR